MATLPPENERTERAADLFAEFRLRQDDGEELTLDAFVQEYPLFEKELRDLDRDERRLASMSGVFGIGGAFGNGPGSSFVEHPGVATQPSVDESAPVPEGIRAARRGSEKPDKKGRTAPRRTGELIEQIVSRENPFIRYSIERKVGQGSMGEVYRVWDQDLRRTLAMKILSRELTARLGMGKDADERLERTLTRFVAEAQVTSQLDHPGIVPVHDFGVSPEGQAYFTMKLVKGRELLSVIDELHDAERYGSKTEWSLQRILELVFKVTEAMAYAHHKGVLHRDLKPTNIMVGRYGAVYVMDWGLARILGSTTPDVMLAGGDMTLRVTSDREGLLREAKDDPNKTKKGASVGTPAYMAPEQAGGQGEFIDERADVYGIGAILYHLVAGHAPYTEPGKRAEVQAVLFRLQQGAPESIDQVAPKAPAELRAIIRTAMARSPKMRFESMEQLGSEIREFLQGSRVVQPSETQSRFPALQVAASLLAAAAAFWLGKLVG